MKHISHSLIWDLIKEGGYCGHYLNLKYNENHRTTPTESMMKGLLFELELLGQTRDGTDIELPKKKNGDPYKWELDVLEDVEYAKMILEKNNIKIHPGSVQEYKEKDNRSGHIDCLGTIVNRDYIIDVKWTGMAFGTWEREWKFGDIKNRFKLQAKQYQSLYDEMMPFVFLIFGHGWCRFIKIEYNEMEIEHHKEVAAQGLKVFNNMEFRPTNDSKLCFACQLRGECEHVNHQIEMEEI